MLDLRPILVMNERGETASFTTTRAGIYLLAKFTARECESANLVANNLFYEQTKLMEAIGARNSWRNYFAMRIEARDVSSFNSYLWSWAGKIINVHQARNGYIYRDEETIVRRDYRFPRRYRQYLRRCECGEIFFDQSIMPYGIAEKIPSHLLGYDGYCPDCVEDYRDVGRCDCCGRWFSRDDLTWVEHSEECVCDDCRDDHYRQCEYCGEWFNCESDDYEYVDETGHYYCCSECCENDGNVWDDNNSCYVPEESLSRIGGYHTHSYCAINGKKDKRKKYPLYIGRETEVDGENRHNFGNDYYDNLSQLFNDTCFFETDGSLDEGFEIITQPLSEDVFFSTDWEKPFNKLIESGFRSHDTDTCGTHFHFSDWYLGYNDRQKAHSALKICRFFQLFADDISKIARRRYGHYCKDLRGFNYVIDKYNSNVFDDLRNDRYWAVNLQNMFRSRKGTIEIRVCKGTLKAKTMLASADFFLHIVRNAKKIAWKNIENLSLWLKGIKNKDTIEYIKARHAFVGAF